MAFTSATAKRAALLAHAHHPDGMGAGGRSKLAGRFEAQAREMHPEASVETLTKVAGQLKRAHYIDLAIKSNASRHKKTKESNR